MFEHQVFVPPPYAIIDLDVMELAGKTTLFGACRLSDMKMGQVVTFETKLNPLGPSLVIRSLLGSRIAV